MDVSFFTNDRYKILDCMVQRQIDVSGNLLVPLSQRQISDITGIAYKTVNSIIRELRTENYILYNGNTRGKYALTDKAKSILCQIQDGGKQ